MNFCRAWVLFTMLPFAATASAADHAKPEHEGWVQFRGPQSSGVASAGKLPAQWGADQNLSWKVPLPGVAWSQPIVWKNQIFVTTAEAENQSRPKRGEGGPGFSLFSRQGLARALGYGGEPPKVDFRWKVFCLDGETGDIVWEHIARAAQPSIPIHRSNSYASETPVTDGERLYVYFGMTGVFCYDLSGQPLWHQSLGSFPMQYGWGTGSSPIVHGEHLYVLCDNEKSSFLVALDKRTGEEVWRVQRDERSNWSTPYLWHNEVRDELVISGGKQVRSYHPDDGTLLWSLDAGGRCSTTPVADRQWLYFGSVSRSKGSSADLVAARVEETDPAADSPNARSGVSIAWSAPRAAPELASPLLYEGCLYVLKQHGGIVTCFDAKTGKRHYRRRLPRAAGFTASPWASDGKVYCLDENGTTFVLTAGSELQILNTNRLDEMVWSSPAVMGNKLLLRGVDHLYCIVE